jgi:hypothetical protein
MDGLESLTNIEAYDKNDTMILENPFDRIIKLLIHSITT